MGNIVTKFRLVITGPMAMLGFTPLIGKACLVTYEHICQSSLQLTIHVRNRHRPRNQEKSGITPLPYARPIKYDLVI